MKFQMTEVLTEHAAKTARLGAGTGAANNVDSKETNKPVKLVGDSRYDLCAAGDFIEGFIESVEGATLDGYSIGAVRYGGRKTVKADGLQATPGVGAIAVGDYVVAGTQTAKGIATDLPKVCKATFQPTSEAAVIGDVNDMVKAALFGWRVVSILTGNGAVGDTLVIERVGVA